MEGADETAADTAPCAVDAAELVYAHMVRCGYSDTAKEFEAYVKPERRVEDYELVRFRAEVMALARKGATQNAVAKVTERFPNLVDNNASLAFSISVVQYIGLLRRGKSVDAMTLAAEHIIPNATSAGCSPETLQSLTALLAFADPDNCPESSSIAKYGHDSLAENINEAILVESGEAARLGLSLDKFCRHAETIARKLLRADVSPDSSWVSQFAKDGTGQLADLEDGVLLLEAAEEGPSDDDSPSRLRVRDPMSTFLGALGSRTLRRRRSFIEDFDFHVPEEAQVASVGSSSGSEA